MIWYDYINVQLKKILEMDSNRNFVIYPFGQIGMSLKNILNMRYLIEEAFIVDNELARYNSKIKSVKDLEYIDTTKYTFFNCKL